VHGFGCRRRFAVPVVDYAFGVLAAESADIVSQVCADVRAFPCASARRLHCRALRIVTPNNRIRSV